MQIQEFENIDCAYCGKSKIISSLKRDWVYKTEDCGKVIYFCSYTCYRRWLKKYKTPKEDNKYYD